MLLGFKDSDGVYKQLIGNEKQLKSLYQQLVLIGYTDTEEEFLNKILTLVDGSKESDLTKLINSNLELIKENQKDLTKIKNALDNDMSFSNTVKTSLNKKVDKEYGKGLSTNDLTNALLDHINAAYDYSQSSHSYNDLTDKPEIPSVEGLASENYVDNKISTYDKYLAEKIYDGIKLKDVSNSNSYVLEISNGVLRTRTIPSDIAVELDISNVSNGDYISPEKIITTMNLEYPDGSNEVLDKYDEVSLTPEYITKDTKEVIISYKIGGLVYNKNITLTNSVKDIDPNVLLQDFNYTDNGDGTYTITGWKQTLNGVSSTELIIPNNKNIKV